MSAYEFYLSDVSLTNGNDTIQINNDDSVFGAIAGSQVFIAGATVPETLLSVDTDQRTITLTRPWTHADAINIAAKISPVGSVSSMLSATNSMQSLFSKYQDVLDAIDLADVFDTVLEMSAVGDGETVDTPSIITDIEKLAALGGGVLKGKPGRVYVHDTIFDIRHDNIIIDLQGAAIKWVGSNTNATGDRTQGILRFKGDTIETETVTATITIADGEFFSREIVVAGQLTITLSQNDCLNFQADEWGSYTEKPAYSFPTIVESVVYDAGADTTTITVRDYFPYPYSGSAKLNRYVPRRNVGLKNATLIDAMSTDSDNGICGVNFGACDGVIWENVHMDGPYFPVATVYGCRNVLMRGGIAKDAKAVEGGQGYYVQFGGCMYTYASDLHLFNGRHTVDFNQCLHAVVERCTGNSVDNADLQTHGSWEYNIVFRDCHGGFNIAGSGASFGSMSSRVRLENCTGKYFLSYGNAFDIAIDDSTFTLISIRTCDITLNNVKTTQYARFNGFSHPVYDIENRCTVNGGSIVSDSYNGAMFIADGANVEFFGADVYCQWDAGAFVTCKNLTMHGGAFHGGFLTDTHKGRWEFNNVTFDGTTFVINNNSFAGAELVMVNPKVRNNYPTGLIRNYMDATGYQLRANDNHPTLDPLDQVTDGHYNIQIIGGIIEVDDPDNDKAMDFAQPRASLNIDVRGLVIESGQFICDMRWAQDNVGELHIELARAGSEAQISISTVQDRFQDGSRDIFEIFDYLPKNRLGNQDVLSHSFPIYAYDNTIDFLANNFPLDATPRGLLKAEYDRIRNIKMLTMTYGWNGYYFDGYVFQNIAVDDSWSGWAKLSPNSDSEIMAKIDTLLTAKIQAMIDATVYPEQFYITYLDRTAQAYIDLPDIVFPDSDWWFSLDFYTEDTANSMWLITPDDAGDTGIHVEQFNDGRLRITGYNDDGYITLKWIAGTYNNARWHRLLFTREGGVISLYIDDFTTPVTTMSWTLGTDFKVSRLGGNSANDKPFAGYFKALRFNLAASYATAPETFIELPISQQLANNSTVFASDTNYNAVIYNITDTASEHVTINVDGDIERDDGTTLEVAYANT